jgi:hypothetical protein
MHMIQEVLGRTVYFPFTTDRIRISKRILGKKLCGVSSRANYTDRLLSATLVPTFADRGVSRGQRNGSLRPRILVFLDRDNILP